MKNKHLEVYKEFKLQLESGVFDNKVQRALLSMVSVILDKNQEKIAEPYSFTKKRILFLTEKISYSEKDDSNKHKYINDRNFNNLIERLINSKEVNKTAFEKLGFIPHVVSSNVENWGRSNEKEYWLEIIEFKAKEEQIDISQISYERKESNKIKPSIFTRLIFTNHELKMRSFKGIAVMLFFMSGVIVEFFLLVFAFLVFLLIRDLKTLKLWELFVYCSFIPMVYMSWIGLFRPLHNLLTHRVIKAPEIFINANVDNADIEIYKGEDGYKVARVTEFIATCPICFAKIELADGKPDQKAPLVGRCREAPHAHVYSFDRVTLKGFFLGHEGYLKSS